MSAEALRAVMKHSTCRGPQLMVQLAIAHLSDSRNGWYPRTTAHQEVIAKAARMSLSRCKTVLAEMIAKGRLFISHKGKGQNAHTYELPIRPVLKAGEQAVLKPVPLNRDEPYTQNPCADSRCEETPSAPPVPPNILPMPVTYSKPKRKHKATG